MNGVHNTIPVNIRKYTLYSLITCAADVKQVLQLLSGPFIYPSDILGLLTYLHENNYALI